MPVPFRRKQLLAAVLAPLAVALATTGALVATREAAPPHAGPDQGQLSADSRVTTRSRVAILDVGGSGPVTRIDAAWRLLQAQGVEIAGLQGLRAAQYDELKASAQTGWATYPDTNPSSTSLSTAIAWRTDVWALVSANAVQVPGRDGVLRGRPYVLLHNRLTNAEVYVANFDNAKDRRRKAAGYDQRRWRRAALGIQSRLVNRLYASGVPVLLTVGTNDPVTRPAAYYCGLLRRSPVRSAAGGPLGPRSADWTCKPPAGLASDQVYATRNVRLPGYRTLTGARAVAASRTPPVVSDVSMTPPPVTPFRVATFNVLGGSHTGPGGSSASYASGYTRMAWTVRLLATYGVDVVGFQEIESAQFARFTSLVRGGWQAYPGNELGKLAVRNSIAWRTDRWELISKQTIKIPYFNGNLIAMPYVLLRNKSTGVQTWFANFHNPASIPSRGDQSRWRRAATKLEVALANTLTRTGIPVVFTGDFNERERFFCAMVQGAPMAAAKGGSRGPGPCVPPPSPPIDWLMGSYSVGFTGYTQLRNDLVRRTSDHPLIFADASANPLAPPATVTRFGRLDVSGGDPDARIDAAGGLLRARGLDLVAFRGLSAAQYDRFRTTLTDWAAFPDPALTSEAYGRFATATSIAWRTSAWSFVSGDFLMVPGRDGVATRRAYVLLRNRATGREIYVLNADNPADRPASEDTAAEPADQAAWRNEAVALEIALINQLRATGKPVLFAATANDPATSPAGLYCSITGSTAMGAAAGGPAGVRPPATPCVAPRLLANDQLYASADVTRSNYTAHVGTSAERASPVRPLSADLLVPAERSG